MIKNEMVCHECDGAGMVPSKETRSQVILCRHCNGHGVVILDKDHIVKYDIPDGPLYIWTECINV